jgi:hypothetical protein
MFKFICTALLTTILSLAMYSAGLAQDGNTAQHHMHMKPHQDHNSHHGGVFFMALDKKHHLEGLLEKPGTFRVYFYDAYTHPLPFAQLKQVNAKVLWSDADNAPETALTISKDGKSLEASKPDLKLPATLTLLVRFPGASPDSKPELFTFPFTKYSGSTTAPHHSM